MKRFGLGLLWLGAALGTATGLAILTGLHPAGWSWLLLVGVAKLAGAGALGLMAGGAVCLRLDARAKARESLGGPEGAARLGSDRSPPR